MRVKDMIETASGDLTATERRLSAALLADYPFAGLEPIHELARRSSVSSPSVSRFVAKLGFQGFTEFQRRLIGELKEGDRSPAEIRRAGTPVEGAFLAAFLGRAEALLHETAASASEAQFERICDLLADPRRTIYVIGGRVSDALAQYLSRHLRQARGGVRHLPADPEFWPDALMAMRRRDVLVTVDFRRYQPSLARLAARAAATARPQIVLLTDPWLSPISAHADETLALPIESGTLWDSYAAAFAVVEALVTRVAEDGWDDVQRRFEAWDEARASLSGDRHDP